MAKKTKAKRTVTCGKCKKPGHNARTCTVTAAKEPAPTPTVPPPPSKKEVKVDALVEQNERRDSRVPRREAPTADIGTAASAAPFRCPKCSQVAILVVVKVKDHVASQKKGFDVFKGETRCEKCMNKPSPSDLILKWGALPNETVDVSNA